MCIQLLSRFTVPEKAEISLPELRTSCSLRQRRNFGSQQSNAMHFFARFGGELGARKQHNLGRPFASFSFRASRQRRTVGAASRRAPTPDGGRRGRPRGRAIGAARGAATPWTKLSIKYRVSEFPGPWVESRVVLQHTDRCRLARHRGSFGSVSVHPLKHLACSSIGKEGGAAEAC
jgi:hypothetical protein